MDPDFSTSKIVGIYLWDNLHKYIILALCFLIKTIIFDADYRAFDYCACDHVMIFVTCGDGDDVHRLPCWNCTRQSFRPYPSHVSSAEHVLENLFRHLEKGTKHILEDYFVRETYVYYMCIFLQLRNMNHLTLLIHNAHWHPPLEFGMKLAFHQQCLL